VTFSIITFDESHIKIKSHISGVLRLPAAMGSQFVLLTLVKVSLIIIIINKRIIIIIMTMTECRLT